MTNQPEKLDLKSMDLAAEKQAELLCLFPEIRTEGGKIDFERLKLALGEMVDVGRERYGLTWPGKADCFKTIQAPSLGTLRPARDESVNFDTTENLIIEGDNLEVLKLLQKSYLGKVKMIYIDPPYNTGHDFIYPDDFTENLQTYLEYTEQADGQGRKFGTNVETDGRFHSRWMNMIYPRLYMARNFLKDDGLILVSIDDNELKALRSIMDEVFGEENFVDTIVWKKRYGGGAKEKHLVTVHEYIVVYAKSKSDLEDIYVPLTQASIDRYYKERDENYERRGPYRTHPLESMKSFEERANLRFPIRAPDGQMVNPKRQWRWGPARVEQAEKAGELHFSRDRDGNWAISSKQYLRDDDGQRETKFFSLIDDVYTQHGTNEILDIFGDAQVFSFPKPSKLIEKLLQVATKSDGSEVVLDFFAGSATTAHGVLSLNASDGGNRRFVLVQLPEKTEHSHFATIAEITKERTRRVIKRIAEGSSGSLDLGGASAQDLGFRVFKLDQSNFTGWDAEASKDAEALDKQLEMGIDHVRQGRSEDDLLYELLLKSGFSLTTPVEKLSLADKTVFSIGGGVFLICLERELTIEVIKAMAEMKPSRVVCLDDGFRGNDQLKTNAVLTFKAMGVAKFQTV